MGHYDLEASLGSVSELRQWLGMNSGPRPYIGETLSSLETSLLGNNLDQT
jgi:hypothetical protein